MYYHTFKHVSPHLHSFALIFMSRNMSILRRLTAKYYNILLGQSSCTIKATSSCSISLLHHLRCPYSCNPITPIWLAKSKYGNNSHYSFIMAAALSSAIYLCSYDDKKKQFLLAAKSGDVKSLKRGLQDGVDVNCTHSLGWAPIHAAVINGHFDTVEWLIKEGGADINITDEFSTANRKARLLHTTPIRIYSIRDEEFCPHINHFISYSGFTPLHYAIITDDERIIRLLLENGADPTIEDAAGRMPIKYCTNGKVKKLLEEFTKQIEMKKLKKTLEERSKYSLEKRLREHLVGQDGAIATVASAIRRREMGWGDSEHPLVLLFLGSSGIGKTELAKQVAKYLHKDDPKAFIRLDMSEYQEKHEVAKLIGAPPGYIGYDQGGQLTTRLSQFPSAVVLFDEVDKAHPDVLTVLLQLFDEGHLTDGQGRKILCKDAIFVMTSNLASDEIAQHGMKLRKEATANMAIDNEPNIEISREFKENIVEPILKQHFHRDEFLGRINEMVYFLPFSRSELHQLVEQELKTWQTRAKERHSIDLSWDKEVIDILADGYNVKYGARSIHHEVERVVVNQLALAYEQQVISHGSHVHLIVNSEDDKDSTIKLHVTSCKKPPLINGLINNFSM